MSNFFKNNLQIIYSVFLVIMIPILIIAISLWQIKTNREDMNYILRQKALLTQNILNESLTGIVSDQTQTQAAINNFKNKNPEIHEISVLKPSPTGYVTMASTNNQLLDVNLSGNDYVSAWTKNNPVENQTKVGNDRIWSVIAPIKDTASESKFALLSVQLTSAEADSVTNRNINLSLVFIGITVFLVLLLLINHFRFFQYSILFKRLQEVDKMKDDFISIASHEMKTPMAAIKGYLSMMFEGLVGSYDAKTKAHLIKINDNVARLDVLVSELLDVSRLEQGRMQFDMQPVDITKIVAESVRTLTDAAQAKNLKLEEQKLTNVPQVFIDPDRVRQVLDNLINNAIKYTLHGGVVIYYRVDQNILKLSIKDTGIGMDEADQHKLFSKFYRIKNDRTVDIPGTGLGLWIAREMIRKMNGDISVMSKENAGSEFTISLPIMKEQ